MQPPPNKQLLGLSLQQLTEIVAELGQPAYRGRQLFQAIYRRRAGGLDEITTLPKWFRAQLGAAGYEIGWPTIEHRFVSRDGTIRYLVGFADGQSVETVWMPEGDGAEDDAPNGEPAAVAEAPASGRAWSRATICVSSQVGCAVNCRFCMTALMGQVRNLSPGEVVGQVLLVLRDQQVPLEGARINLVFMGQGEPFLNYDHFMSAVRLLVEGAGLAESGMTVSTSGIVPRIEQFGREPIRPRLAISLNAPNDEVREQVMPINRKWNLKALLDAARAFPLRPRERLTFEYVLLDRVTDAPEHARELVRLLQRIRAKVNLIALNPGPEIPFRTPGQERVLAFQQILIDAGIPAFIRRPRGRDIYAACGQLKRMSESELPIV